MPTFTTNYNLSKPLVNNATDQDLWGNELNGDLDSLDTLLRSGITIATQSVQTSGFNADVSISVKKLYPCDATSGTLAAQLPLASDAKNGSVVYFKKTDSSANTVVITRAGSDTIDGMTTFPLAAQYSICGLVSNGVDGWSVIAKADSVFVGDTGSGGMQGLVPAPAAGTAAKRYMLGAGGSFTSQTCVQRVSTETGAVVTGSGTFSQNDTIPTNSNGSEFITLAVTPKDSSNKLVIDVRLFISNNMPSGNNQIVAALFQDSTANALAVASTCNVANGNPYNISFQHIMAAGTTSATTFKIRAGGTTSGATYLNGVNGSRLFGGVYASSIMITEYSE